MKHVARDTVLPNGSASVLRNWLRVSLPSDNVSQCTPSQSDCARSAVEKRATAGGAHCADASLQATVS